MNAAMDKAVATTNSSRNSNDPIDDKMILLNLSGCGLLNSSSCHSIRIYI